MRSNIKLWQSHAIGGTYVTKDAAYAAASMAFGAASFEDIYPIWICIYKKSRMADELSAGAQPYALLPNHPEPGDDAFPDNG